MKKRWIAAWLFALFCAAPLGGCSLFPEEEEPLDVPISSNTEVTYVTTLVKRGDLEDNVIFTALFQAVHTADVAFVTDGRIEQIHFDEGDSVQAGDILIELENDDAQFNLDCADIQMEIQELKFENTASRYSASSLAYQIAEKQMELQQLEYDKLKSKVDQSYLYAPLSGVVTYRKDEMVPGDFLEKNVKIFTVADTSVLCVESSTSETERLQVGMEAELSMPAVGFSCKAVITHMPGDEAEDGKEYDNVILEVADALQSRIAGYFGQVVNVKINLGSRYDTLYVPKNVVQRSGSTTYLRVLVDGVVMEKTVQTGVEVNGYVEILEGVEEGDEVIYK